MTEKVSSKDKVAFLPWSAINAFMLEEFQLEVIKDVLTGYEYLESEQRRSLNAQIKRGVRVPGFRNSTTAPIGIRIKNSIEFFEKNAAFAGNVLSAWTVIHADLAEKVHAMLEGREWQILPLNAARENLPGFLTQWPQEDEFEVLCAAFRELYPDEQQYSDNQVSLMSVWLSGRLPYELVEKETLMEKDETQETED